MSEWHLLALFIPVSFFTGYVRGLTGFGGPLIFIPVLAFVVSPVSAAATGVVVDMSSNISLLRSALTHASLRTVCLTAIGAAAAIPLGGMILLKADADFVRQLLYVSVGVAAIMLLTGWRFPRALKPAELLGAGTVAGAVMGATGLGILIVPVLFSTPDNAKTSRANLVVWVFLVSLLLATMLAVGGGLSMTELTRGLLLAPAYLVGTFVGQKSFGYIDEKRFRALILVFLLLFSAAGLVFG